MVYYEPIPASDGTSLTAPSNAEFRVFEVSDTARANPVELRTVAGTNAAPLVTTAQGVLPGVEVVSPNFSHIFKSGEWEWRRDSVEGIRKAAEAARAESVAARGAAERAVSEVTKPADEAVDEGIARANLPNLVTQSLAAQPTVIQAAAAAVNANPKLTQIEATIPQVLTDAKTYADAEVTKDRKRLGTLETNTVPKALSDAKAYADEVELAAVDASLGSKVISYAATSGRPYWDAATGTHRIFVNYDGRPYASITPDITTTTPSGRPALNF